MWEGREGVKRWKYEYCIICGKYCIICGDNILSYVWCVCVFVSAGFGYMAFLRCIKGCCEEIYHNKCWCLCLRVVTCSGENSQETELKRTKRAKLSYLIKLSWIVKFVHSNPMPFFQNPHFSWEFGEVIVPLVTYISAYY